MTEYMLPPERPARLAGDELTDARLISLFRASYASAQGRQWLQANILWWALKYMRHNGIGLDLDALDSPVLTRRIISLGLPRGHAHVHPPWQTAANFGLWWRLLRELARTVYQGEPLPDLARVEHIAWRLGLRPWVSSATPEEMAGIGRALDAIAEHHQAEAPLDDFMVRRLLPGLLLTELHWLHAPGGRPGNRRAHLVFAQRYDHALTKWGQGLRLTALDHMYLRAGEITDHLTTTPASVRYPHLGRIADLAAELECVRPPAALGVGGAS